MEVFPSVDLRAANVLESREKKLLEVEKVLLSDAATLGICGFSFSNILRFRSCFLKFTHMDTDMNGGKKEAKHLNG